MADVSKWQKLIDIMAALRGPEGCPWDKAQDHESLKKYFLEETYEVLDAIDSKSDSALCDELGDALFQVVFHARIAEEENRFTIDDVVDAISNKMIRRHPHIFGMAHAENPEEVLTLWESIKAQEKKDKKDEKRGLMMINTNLPALMMAQKVQDKAHRVGFEWPSTDGAWDKLREEMQELAAAKNREEVMEELGDVLFAAVNVGRLYDVDGEQALRRTVKKFINRFNFIENQMEAAGGQWGEYDTEALSHLWDQAKELEKSGQLPE